MLKYINKWVFVCLLQTIMSQWMKETVSYILAKGTAKMYTYQDLLYGVIDIKDLKEGKDYISFGDQVNVFSLFRYDTDDDNFHAYLGIKYSLIGVCRYYTCAIIALYDKRSESYVLIEIDNTRTMMRFRSSMYNGLKIGVFKKLYQHFYMLDIDFDNNII